jgi:hypothetical protein
MTLLMAKRESRRRVVKFTDPEDRAAAVNLGLSPDSCQIYLEDPAAEAPIIGEELEACRAELRAERREFRIFAQRLKDRGLLWASQEVEAILDKPRGTYLGRRYGPTAEDRLDLASPRPKRGAGGLRPI